MVVGDEVTAIVAKGAKGVTVVIAIEARATDMEVVEVAMAAAVMVHRTALRTCRLLLLAPQMRTDKLLTTTLNMPSGPLTMPAIQPRIRMLPTEALQQSWPNIRRAAMDSTMVKRIRPDRRNPLHLAPGLRHHPLPQQSLQVMELLPLHHHRLLDHQELATVQFLLHLACKCCGLKRLTDCTDDISFAWPHFGSLFLYCLGFDISLSGYHGRRCTEMVKLAFFLTSCNIRLLKEKIKNESCGTALLCDTNPCQT